MKVLVLAAHPDDEAIGCGGRIRQHVLAGDEVYVVFMTGGEKGCPGMSEEDTRLLRIHEGFEASKVLGSKVFRYLEYPDGGIPYEQAWKDIITCLNEISPDVVYVTSQDDSHPDHRQTANALRMALSRGIHNPMVWQYEIWTPFQEYDELIDITEEIGTKLKAIRRHESQVNRIRFDEAALSLARFRGELHNRPHGPYAEAYKLL